VVSLRPGRFTPGERTPGTRLMGIEPPNPNRPARSQSLLEVNSILSDILHSGLFSASKI